MPPRRLSGFVRSLFTFRKIRAPLSIHVTPFTKIRRSFPKCPETITSGLCCSDLARPIPVVVPVWGPENPRATHPPERFVVRATRVLASAGMRRARVHVSGAGRVCTPGPTDVPSQRCGVAGWDAPLYACSRAGLVGLHDRVCVCARVMGAG